MKKHRRKGYTLIELVAVMAILAILLGSGVTIVQMLNNIKNEVELESAAYEVSSILSYAKAYCRKNSYEGEILIDSAKNSIMFNHKSERNNKVLVQNKKISNNTKIAFSADIMSINIDNKGYLKDAGSILINGGDYQVKITIAVGHDLITIQDKKNN